MNNSKYQNVRRCLRKNAQARKLLRAVVKSYEENLLTTREFRNLMKAAGKVK